MRCAVFLCAVACGSVTALQIRPEVGHKVDTLRRQLLALARCREYSSGRYHDLDNFRDLASRFTITYKNALTGAARRGRRGGFGAARRVRAAGGRQ